MVSRAQVKEDGFYVCLLQGKGFASSGESRVLLGTSRLLECLAISINTLPTLRHPPQDLEGKNI